MPLKLRPTGLGSGIDKDRPDYSATPASGRSAASTRRVAVPTACAGSGRRGPRGDLGRGESAVSEELGRLEGVGEIGGSGLKKRGARC